MDVTHEYALILGATIAVLILSSFFKAWISNWLSKPEGAYIGSSIIQVATVEECGVACSKLLKDCRKLKALGFDCEWVSEAAGKKSRPRPVSLLQLASPGGLCCLFRLNKLQHIPNDLKLILENGDIKKMGVNCLQDAKLIAKDYGVEVRSCLDLRHLYQMETSLASLAKTVTGINLKKDVKIVSSNWNEETLSESQVNYAANDAMIAVDIFKSWLRNNSEGDADKYLDIPFQFRKNIKTTVVRDDGSIETKEVPVRLKFARKKPLYDNCWMYAPDGELLCSCDRKKADWYIQRGLAELQSEDPYSIRLLFEPNTRPSQDNDVDFYRQLKRNNCVVCGSQESYMKHYVVPKEYRKHFPASMKSHQSHDVVLTCVKCHIKAKNHMRKLREELAVMCNAPTFTEQSSEYKKYAKMKNICKTLSAPGSNIPQDRRAHLEGLLKEFFEVSEINDDVLKRLAVSSGFVDKKKDNHGKNVVEYFEKRENGLVEFEEMWRKHFLDSLQPQFLPSLWSVHHNHKRETSHSERGGEESSE